MELDPGKALTGEDSLTWELLVIHLDLGESHQGKVASRAEL
jgi:hypothetical protein